MTKRPVHRLLLHAGLLGALCSLTPQSPSFLPCSGSAGVSAARPQVFSPVFSLAGQSIPRPGRASPGLFAARFPGLAVRAQEADTSEVPADDHNNNNYDNSAVRYLTPAPTQYFKEMRSTEAGNAFWRQKYNGKWGEGAEGDAGVFDKDVLVEAKYDDEWYCAQVSKYVGNSGWLVLWLDDLPDGSPQASVVETKDMKLIRPTPINE
ncbi:unnamed protein product [Polarella glacialis]|uniref:Uncharacterized protein n=1 Tax=Polarella glacialis TaxID=89957 RepID=A0A813KR87_POLGL|nr:unnamed protein product [Polarella glacialis]